MEEHMADHDDPQAPAIARLLAETKDGIARSREDVPGWLLSRPTVTEVEDAFAFVRADSKDDESAPFILPSEATEVIIAVLKGSIAINGHSGPLGPGRFYRIGRGDGREIISLEPHTTIICTFFRKGVTDGATADLDGGEIGRGA
jgi:hypothetical protein